MSVTTFDKSNFEFRNNYLDENGLKIHVHYVYAICTSSKNVHIALSCFVECPEPRMSAICRNNVISLFTCIQIINCLLVSKRCETYVIPM